ncbi:hypothetical protein TYRP_008505 [Tyrophagus putrescentiae]|nr:hypothetical protein TYRP_008505 [Tyrophagus putrescentiae]
MLDVSWLVRALTAEQMLRLAEITFFGIFFDSFQAKGARGSEAQFLELLACTQKPAPTSAAPQICQLN